MWIWSTAPPTTWCSSTSRFAPTRTCGAERSFSCRAACRLPISLLTPSRAWAGDTCSRAVPRILSSSTSAAPISPRARGLVEHTLQMPGAAHLVEVDGAQQPVAGDQLEIGAGGGRTPPVVVHAPAVADPHLAMGGAVQAQAQRRAELIGVHLDEGVVEVEAGHSPTSLARCSGSDALGRSWLGRPKGAPPHTQGRRSRDQRSSSQRPPPAPKAR